MERRQDILTVSYMPEKEARNLFGNELYEEIDAELDKEYYAEREKELKELEKWVNPKIKSLIPNIEK